MSSDIILCLKNTFGGIPPFVYQHMKYFTYDECREEFFCVLCDKVIQKHSPRTMEAHLQSESHRNNSCSKNEVTNALMITFPDKIPQIVQNNIDVFDILEYGYKCVICDKEIQVSRDPKMSMDIFSYHLTSFGHERKLKTHDEQLQELEDVYGQIPLLVDNNKEFLQLTRSGKNYVCTLCNVLLKVHKEDAEETENLFNQHFQSHEHLWSAKRSKVLSLVPELQHSESYLMRNIDYISKNGVDFFCSLCHENIKNNPHVVNETKENLKYHILSSAHIENVFGRQNHNSVRLKNMMKVFGGFTDYILMNLRYLKLDDSSFSCTICNEEFYIESECDEVNDMILHLESDFHQNNVSDEEFRCNNVVESLGNIFGKLPQAIEENIEYLEFVHGNSFQCTLCHVTVQLRNLERHLSTNRHTMVKENKEIAADSLHDDLEDILGEDFVDEMPQCIFDNLSHIEYERDTGNFCCTLCDETILVDEGNKKEEITLHNFKSHLLSAEHTIKLKEKATRKLRASEKLESVFGAIPKCILINLNYLNVIDIHSFSCDECIVEIQCGNSTRTTAQNFIKHLRGSLHKSNVKYIETSIDCAFNFFDQRFCVPECLLRNIDFWDNSGDLDLYCTLCQQELSVDLDDLKQSRLSLEFHLDSDRHKSNLENL